MFTCSSCISDQNLKSCMIDKANFYHFGSACEANEPIKSQTTSYTCYLSVFHMDQMETTTTHRTTTTNPLPLDRCLYLSPIFPACSAYFEQKYTKIFSAGIKRSRLYFGLHLVSVTGNAQMSIDHILCMSYQ